MKNCYSLYGEDIVLDHIFENQNKGYYVDVGSFHPEYFSNTKKLYDKGWRGINIDANPDTIDLFNELRPDDINLNFAISDVEGIGDYYKFLEIDSAGGGSGNTLSKSVKEGYEKEGLSTTTIKIQMKQLKNILEKYSSGKTIDFLNVDVEGFDLKALQSNDWQKFRPKIMAVEIWMHQINYDQLEKNMVYGYLRSLGYKAFSNTIHTWFFYDSVNPIPLFQVHP